MDRSGTIAVNQGLLPRRSCRERQKPAAGRCYRLVSRDRRVCNRTSGYFAGLLVSAEGLEPSTP
jgi:hypothetical protein